MAASFATGRVWHGVATQLDRLARLQGDRFGVEGSWSGNDTIWRTCLDLNRILLYGRADASLAHRIQRRVVHLVDAIMAGQGDGPLAPQPLPLGLIFGGSNAAAVDWVGARLLGYRSDAHPHRPAHLRSIPVAPHSICSGCDQSYRGLGNRRRGRGAWTGRQFDHPDHVSGRVGRRGRRARHGGLNASSPVRQCAPPAAQFASRQLGRLLLSVGSGPTHSERATVHVGNSSHKNSWQLTHLPRDERGTSLAEMGRCESAATSFGCCVPDPVRAGRDGAADD